MIERMRALLGAPLGRGELESMAAALEENPRELQSDAETYFSFPRAGLSLLRDADGLLAAIHVYLESDGAFRRYAGQLPFGLKPSMQRADVRALLGTPAKVGAAGGLGYLGVTPSWDRFSFSDQTLHVQYSDGGLPILLTLMSQAATP
jgi:hypothetical protein